MRRGRPLASLRPQTLIKPMRDQHSRADEERYERELEWADEFALHDLEPDHDPDDDYPAAA
jgi:hypothetical protein